MTRFRTYQVKDVARFAGVSVRTLHHYDAIGLLVPSRRSAAGYRLYTDEDLLRLQQILIGRELGLSLEEIRRSVDEPGFDRKTALVAQRERLNERARLTHAMIRSIEVALAALEATKGDWTMKDLFEGFNPSDLADEARSRWGQSEAFVQAETRTRRYSLEDWQAIKAEQARLFDAAYAALQAGRTADDPIVMDIAEQHRLSIDRWFYACSRQMHCALASMYQGDDRFRQSIERHGEGLTAFLAEAIRANASRKRP